MYDVQPSGAAQFSISGPIVGGAGLIVGLGVGVAGIAVGLGVIGVEAI